MKMPTSSTGKTSAVPDASATGFTLMELMVVLTIVALVAAVAAPRLVGSGVAARLEADARAVEDMLDRARLTALSGNRDTMVTVDMAGGILTGPNGAQTQLQSARVSSMTTAEALVTGETGRFRFFFRRQQHGRTADTCGGGSDTHRNTRLANGGGAP